MSKFESKFGLPNNVEFCTKCVISNQRPSSEIEFKHNIKTKKKTINFDDKSICDACQHAANKDKINWKAREEELIILLDHRL